MTEIIFLFSFSLQIGVILLKDMYFQFSKQILFKDNILNELGNIYDFKENGLHLNRERGRMRAALGGQLIASISSE